MSAHFLKHRDTETQRLDWKETRGGILKDTGRLPLRDLCASVFPMSAHFLKHRDLFLKHRDTETRRLGTVLQREQVLEKFDALAFVKRIEQTDRHERVLREFEFFDIGF